MKTYTVHIRMRIQTPVTVEADSPQEAAAKAKASMLPYQMVKKGVFEQFLGFSVKERGEKRRIVKTSYVTADGKLDEPAKEPELIEPCKPDDLWDEANLSFYAQQVALWAKYMLAGSPSLDVICVEDEDIANAFQGRETPHDFIEWMIQKYDLDRPDPYAARTLKAPVCPYHQFSER